MTCRDCIHYVRCIGLDDFDRIHKLVMRRGCGYYRSLSRFVELPCKTGDIVYSIFNNKLTRDIVTSIAIGNNNELIIYTPLFSFTISEINKYVFYTREKAEQALKEQNEQKFL